MLSSLAFMGASPRHTKLLIAALGAAVIGLTIALFVVSRGPEAPAPASSSPRPSRAEAPSQPSGGGFARTAPSLGAPSRPPARRRNELGQPLNEDGRPIGPPEKLARIRNKPIEPGEVPLTPPLFQDPAQRARFKRWWVDELARRIAIYQELEPRDGYPSAEQTAAMLDELYDAAEPRAPGESVDDAYARRQTWHRLWKDFLDSHGATLHTVMTRAGDPQYGQTPPPPVQPSNVPQSDVPPAEPAADSPPGRGPGQEATPPQGDRRAPGN